MKIRNCEVCGDSFNPRGGKQKTCEKHLGMKKVACQECGAELLISRDNKRKMCDVCRVGERPCKHCGKVFTPNPNSKRVSYCSTECSHKDRYEEGRYFKKMENGYQRKGREDHASRNGRIAREICFSTHSRVCWICGFNNDEAKIHAHHIDEDRTHNTPDNLIPVCDPCHRMIHVLIRREKERPNQGTLQKLAEVVNLNLLKTRKP